MSASRATERFWGAILLAYPRWYRRDRGAEILGVLMARGGRPSFGETLGLVCHGLATRFLDPRRRGTWRPATGMAAVVMTVAMGTFGLSLCWSAVFGAVRLRWFPSPSIGYVDPRWVLGLCWVVALGLLLFRLPRLAAAAAWTGLAAHVALLLGVFVRVFGREPSFWWPYDNGRALTVLLLQVAPTLALALLLVRPSATRHALEQTGRRLPALCAVAGFVALLVLDWRVVGVLGTALALAVMARHGVLLRGSLAAASGVAVVAVAQPFLYSPWFYDPRQTVLIVVALTGALLLVVLAVGRWLERDTRARRWAADELDRLACALRRPVA